MQQESKSTKLKNVREVRPICGLRVKKARDGLTSRVFKPAITYVLTIPKKRKNSVFSVRSVVRLAGRFIMLITPHQISSLGFYANMIYSRLSFISTHVHGCLPDKEMTELKQTNIIKRLSSALFAFLFLAACGSNDMGLTQTPDAGEKTPMSAVTTCPQGSFCPTDSVEGTSSPLPNQMIFSEEFDGDSLLPPFRPLPIWFDHPGITDEKVMAQAIWTEDSVFVSGGYLHLRATRLETPQQGRQYASGYVQTGGYLYDPTVPSRKFQYGYFEARIFLPETAGAWPAFWLWSDPYSPQEIDIVEILMRQPNVTYHTLHYDGEVFQVSKRFPQALTGWHTFSVDWQPGLIVWYVDNLEAGRYEDRKNRFSDEMYIVLSLQMGGVWAGTVDESQLPAEMLVDYVRVWEQKP